MAVLDIKFTKFDNRPWGFRLAGGSDFPQPLTVLRVTEESLAECMGLKVGDIILKLNDQQIAELTHGQAHEALTLAGNNFVLTVLRAEDLFKLPDIPLENLVPYAIPLESLPPLLPVEEKLKENGIESEDINDTEDQEATREKNEKSGDRERDEEKPTDENSVVVAKKDLTDEQIAELILEEEEILTEKGTLGVNFKKLRPRLPNLKDSKVVEALQKDALEDSPVIQERKRTTTFMQKPERHPPAPKKVKQESQNNVEPYRVVIKKQPKKSITEKLLEKGLIQPEDVKTFESRSEINTPDLGVEVLGSCPQSTAEVIDEVVITEVSADQEVPLDQALESRIEEPAENETNQSHDNDMPLPTTLPTFDQERVQELVKTELNLEKQLESVQTQLSALKDLPSEIEKRLRIVSDQLHLLMQLSGVQNGVPIKEENCSNEKENQEVEESCHKAECNAEENKDSEQHQESQSELQPQSESEWDDPSFSMSFTDNVPQITEPTQPSVDSELQELEISMRSEEEDGKRVKKYIVSYETKLLEKKEIKASRDPSPTMSHGSFEPDPNLKPQDQVIQELQQRAKDKKKSKELWPQARQLELTYGRRWRCPNDFFNDEMIAEVLQGQAEVIRGRALGVNFKKFEKTALPNYDHLMNSSVYKMIHNMEREPKKGIPARPPIVNAAEDILERLNSPMDTLDDRSSFRSVSH